MQLTADELASINGVVALVARLSEHVLSSRTKMMVTNRSGGNLWFEVYDFGDDRFVKVIDITDNVTTIEVGPRPEITVPDQPIGPIDPNDPNGGGTAGTVVRYAQAA